MCRCVSPTKAGSIFIFTGCKSGEHLKLLLLLLSYIKLLNYYTYMCNLWSNSLNFLVLWTLLTFCTLFLAQPIIMGHIRFSLSFPLWLWRRWGTQVTCSSGFPPCFMVFQSLNYLPLTPAQYAILQLVNSLMFIELLSNLRRGLFALPEHRGVNHPV